MPFTIICSVGTSAAKGVCPPAQLAQWVAERGGPETAAALLLSQFADIAPEAPALQKTLSAEIHSLVRIGVTGRDRVVLLSSATGDGRACALAVARYLEKYYDGVAVCLETIEGLQVDNAELFRREGVVNYVRACLRAVHDATPAYAILNPTGGFKALVAYTALVGMVKRVPCRYIFEQSTQLLGLPPLPVAFDRVPYERYRELFERIERETAIPRADWDAAVRYEDRPLVEPMVEPHAQEITLSAIGLLLLDEFRTPTALVPFLSRQAWADCLDNLCKLKECDPFRYLLRTASDRNYLNQKTHLPTGNGLIWLKPGRTTDRYLVSVEDWRLLVWRAIREDEVGSDYLQRIEVDPQRERGRYAPFTRMEFAPSAHD